MLASTWSAGTAVGGRKEALLRELGNKSIHQRLSIAVSCSVPPSAFQAAERRASFKACSTSSRSCNDSASTSLRQQEAQAIPTLWQCHRRGLLLGAAGLLGLSLHTPAKMTAMPCHTHRQCPEQAGGALPGCRSMSKPSAFPQASKLPPAFDRAWEKIGGGPADLYFPDEFLGIWSVESTLTSIKLPLGPDFVPDPKVVKRAEDEDMNRNVRYQVAFIRNGQGRVITDRRYNTLSLLDYYLGHGKMSNRDIAWSAADPNLLSMTLPGGLDVTTRVTRRSENESPPNRLDTSEYFQQISGIWVFQGTLPDCLDTSEYFQQTYVAPGRLEPKVKASQCFTKYKWRDLDAAKRQSGPQIVATQVVSDYLTPYDGEMKMMRSNSQPVVVYSYRMRFWRDPMTAPSSA